MTLEEELREGGQRGDGCKCTTCRAADRIHELEAAILVHRQQEPNCRCGFEIVLPSKPPQSDAGGDAPR